MARICLDKRRVELLSDLVVLLGVVVTIGCGAVLGLLVAIRGWELQFGTATLAVIALALAVWLAHLPSRKYSSKSADSTLIDTRSMHLRVRHKV